MKKLTKVLSSLLLIMCVSMCFAGCDWFKKDDGAELADVSVGKAYVFNETSDNVDFLIVENASQIKWGHASSRNEISNVTDFETANFTRSVKNDKNVLTAVFSDLGGLSGNSVKLIIVVNSNAEISIKMETLTGEYLTMYDGVKFN